METQIMKILRILIFGHFDGLQKDTLKMISPRNHIYRLEKEFNEKLNRKRVRGNKGNYYTEYRIASIESMQKAIALYKKYGGELSRESEKHALNRLKI